MCHGCLSQLDRGALAISVGEWNSRGSFAAVSRGEVLVGPGTSTYEELIKAMTAPKILVFVGGRCLDVVEWRCDWSGWIKQHGFGGDVRGFSWFVLWLKLFGKFDYLLQHVSCVLHPKLPQFCRWFAIVGGHFKMFKGSLVWPSLKSSQVDLYRFTQFSGHKINPRFSPQKNICRCWTWWSFMFEALGRCWKFQLVGTSDFRPGAVATWRKIIFDSASKAHEPRSNCNVRLLRHGGLEPGREGDWKVGLGGKSLVAIWVRPVLVVWCFKRFKNQSRDDPWMAHKWSVSHRACIFIFMNDI